ncbi:MAG: DUF2927 domain-containing protein [Pseudomonadota bacterium]
MTRATLFRRLTLYAAAAAILAGCADGTQTRYRDLTDAYAAIGFLRTDAAPPDAPFDNDDLIRNFERIAFYSEFARGDGPLEVRRTPTPLFKWEGPVTWKLEGDAATQADRRAYQALIARLERLTDLDFAETQDSANVLILIASKDQRGEIVDLLDARGLSDRMQLIREWARDDVYPCVAQVGRVEREDGAPDYRAFIVIKEETQGLLRLSCIHEELVQAMGLRNDDDRVRPSIFNDDQEFALLTEHDEYLLRILYDRRLRHDMTAEEGMPIVRRIVEEIGPGRDAGG